ncbi:MAG: FG-GAP repeat domain-containing protein, partial [Bacteroidota bacterium]
MSADFTGDGMDEILLVHRGERRISIITNLTADTLRPLTVLHLPVEPTCVIVGDVNNDKRLDILVADRKNLGVIPFLGVGRGQFRQAAVIAPDSAVEDMLLLYLNNDMLLDLVFYDWVNSELHFSYGVGRGRFVDLTLLPVEGTVKKMYATKLGRNRFIDLVLLVDQPPELQIWEGDVTGDFHKRNTFSVAHPAAALDVADFNNDGWNDFIFLDRKDVLRVVLNSPDGNNPFWLEYATGRGARQVLAADVNSDGRMDAIVLQREPRQLLVYSNAAQEHVLRDSLQFSVGVEPRGLWIGDVDGDGDNDVVVVNRGSGALSLLAGRGAKGLIGQTMVPIADGPQQLSFHSSSDSTVNFFVSYPSTRSISYLSIRREDLSTVNALIPGVGVMELLYANSTAQGQAEFFCYNLASGTRSPSLVFYQQLGQQTFIERTFRLTIPDVLLGAALGDINKDGIVDIAFAYHNNDLGRNEIIFSLGDSALSFRQRFQTVSLLGENSRRSHMWLRDFDRNDTLDLLLVFPKTEKTIMLAKGTKDRKFEPPRLVQG